MSMHHDSDAGRGGFWRSKAGWVTIAFLAVGAFLLLSEHRAHALGFLPYLFLLACPLMHVFMHSGHGSHGGHEHHGRQDSIRDSDARSAPSEGT